MGFHAAAFGLYINHDICPFQFLRLVARTAKITLPNGNVKMFPFPDPTKCVNECGSDHDSESECGSESDHDNESECGSDMSDDIEDYIHECELQIELYDDIVTDEHTNTLECNVEDLSAISLNYKHNKSILIGAPHICAFMIYLGGCVGSDLGGDGYSKTIPESALTDLLKWKEELVRDNRLPADVKLKLRGNCCS